VREPAEPIAETEGGCLVHMRALPRGSREEVVGVRDGRICVRTTAPPVEGAANKRILEFLAKTLGVRKSDVSLVSGDHAREKTVRVAGLSAAEARAKLLP
jgi:uncharacterized protein